MVGILTPPGAVGGAPGIERARRHSVDCRRPSGNRRRPRRRVVCGQRRLRLRARPFARDRHDLPRRLTAAARRALGGRARAQDSSAATTSASIPDAGVPSLAATVLSSGGTARAPSASMAVRSASVRSAPSRSPLFTTSRSAISSRPAFSAWTSSPRPGAVTTTTASAASATSSSACPAPTVSTKITGNPAASSTATDGRGRAREPTLVAARGQRADEDAVVGGVAVHPHAIAQERAARKRAGGIDGHHRDPLTARAVRRRPAP